MKKVLVVDDDPDILQLVKIALTMNGLDVTTLAQWEKLDGAIRECMPGLILLDISLGSADGREICRDLKMAEGTKDIPVILFSANVEFQRGIEEWKAESFIAKPFELKKLVETVKAFAK
ncbi:MAG TPA: response regulator [Puia sp.]|nr:response regulator [Puia sp.]